ncbi:unnamed protein product, partial [Brassica rapa]
LLFKHKPSRTFLDEVEWSLPNKIVISQPWKKMSSRSKAWLVAATIGAVEASKDQLGLCRWNYMIRSVNQRIRNNVRSAAQANRFSSSSTTALASCKDCDKAKQAEESLRTVISGDLCRIGLRRKPRRATKATQPWNPIGRIPVAHVFISGFLRRQSRGIVGLSGYLGNYGEAHRVTQTVAIEDNPDLNPELDPLLPRQPKEWLLFSSDKVLFFYEK